MARAALAAAALAWAGCGDSVRDAATPPVAPVTIRPTRPPTGGSVEAWLRAEAPAGDAGAGGGPDQRERAAARALVAAGDRARAAGEDEAALDSYRAAVERAPTEPRARFALAAAYADAGALGAALEQLEQLAELARLRGSRGVAAATQLRAARVDPRFDALRASTRLGARYRALTGYYPVAVAGTRGLAGRVGAALPDPTGAMVERLVARSIPASVRRTPWRSGARVATVVFAKDVPAAKAMAEEVAGAMVFPPRMVASKRFHRGDPVVVVVPPSAARALAAAKGASVAGLWDRTLRATGADGAEHRLRFDHTGAFHWRTVQRDGGTRDRRGRYLFTGARLHLTYREELLPAGSSSPPAAGPSPSPPGAGTPRAEPAAEPDAGAGGEPTLPRVQQGRRSSYDVSLTPDTLTVGDLRFRLGP